MLSTLTSWTCADFFYLNNNLDQVVIQSKKVRTSPTRLGVRVFQSCQKVWHYSWVFRVAIHQRTIPVFFSFLQTSCLCLVLTLTHSLIFFHYHSATPSSFWAITKRICQINSWFSTLSVTPLFNSTGVTGAVLQTPLSLIQSTIPFLQFI